MAVLFTAPYFQAFDDDGNPLTGGKVYTYAAGTSTPKAAFTTAAGDIEHANPIVLDAGGRAVIFIQGSYKYIITDANDNVIRTVDNVTSFDTLGAATDPFFESFSGTGSQTVYTLSEDFGTDSKNILVFVQEPNISDVFSGDGSKTVFTLSSHIGTDEASVIVEVANVTLPTTGYTISGNEITFAVAPANGSNNVQVKRPSSKPFGLIPPTAYTLNGTSLIFATAPQSGTGNILVFSPSAVIGSAAASAAAAAASESAAAASEIAAAASASSAAGFAVRNKWVFSSTTAMADPATGNIRLNDAALASVTQIAISDLSGNSGNPDVSGWIDTWDDAGGTNRGTIFVFKDESNFALYSVNAASTDNTSWFQIPVTYQASSGSFTDLDVLYIGFASSGMTTVTGGITETTGDVLMSGAGSVVATIANGAITANKYADGSIARSKLDASVFTPQVQTVTSATTVTPTSANDMVDITAQAASLLLANPSGTMLQGQALVIRIKDNGTARAISYGTDYRAVGVVLPTTTVITKTIYLFCIWNANDAKFDVTGVALGG